MKSINLNIAFQVRTALMENRETAMSLRGLSEAEISMFVRHDELQKFSFDDVCYSLTGDSIDNDFEGIPADVYKNLCSLIFNEIKELKVNLNYRSIVIGWKYDASKEEFTDTSFALRKEVHFGRM